MYSSSLWGENVMTLTNTTQTLYETDFVAWAEQMATLLEQHRFEELDLLNLVDEVQDLSRRERQALYSNLKVLLMHLLKWQFQPDQRSNSWNASITEHRQRINRQLKESPSLKPYFTQIWAECYQDARQLAAKETGLNLVLFPSDSLYDELDALDDRFLPEE
jgi:hypothetical protein